MHGLYRMFTDSLYDKLATQQKNTKGIKSHQKQHMCSTLHNNAFAPSLATSRLDSVVVPVLDPSPPFFVFWWREAGRLGRGPSVKGSLPLGYVVIIVCYAMYIAIWLGDV